MALGTARHRGVGDIDRAKDIGLDGFVPVALQQRYVLERRGMKHDVGPEGLDQPDDPLAVADVGDAPVDGGARMLQRQGFVLRRQRLHHGVQRGLGVFDDHQPRDAVADQPVANLGPDRAAAAGDHGRLAAHESFEPAIVDLCARAQQQVFDTDRLQPRRAAVFFEPRHPHRRQADPARPREHGLGLHFRRQSRRRHHQARHHGAAVGEILHHPFEVAEIAHHRDAADRVAAIRPRRRQNPDRLDRFIRLRFRCRAGSPPRRRRGRAPERGPNRPCGRAAACACSENTGRPPAPRPGRKSAGTNTVRW